MPTLETNVRTLTDATAYRGRAFGYGRQGATGVLEQWQEFVKNQMRLGGHSIAAPKLVCIDLQPNTTTQAPSRADILNVGGFSDAVFSVVAEVEAVTWSW